MQEQMLDVPTRGSGAGEFLRSGSARRYVPIRTCIGCRQRAEVTELLRVVADPEHQQVLADPPQRSPGRGAYLHPVLDCFDQAVRRRAFPRALRASTPLDNQPLQTYLQQQVDEVRRLGKTQTKGPIGDADPMKYHR